MYVATNTKYLFNTYNREPLKEIALSRFLGLGPNSLHIDPDPFRSEVSYHINSLLIDCLIVLERFSILHRSIPGHVVQVDPNCSFCEEYEYVAFPHYTDLFDVHAVQPLCVLFFLFGLVLFSACFCVFEHCGSTNNSTSIYFFL